MQFALSDRVHALNFMHAPFGCVWAASSSQCAAVVSARRYCWADEWKCRWMGFLCLFQRCMARFPVKWIIVLRVCLFSKVIPYHHVAAFIRVAIHLRAVYLHCALDRRLKPDCGRTHIDCTVTFSRRNLGLPTCRILFGYKISCNGGFFKPLLP